MTDPIQEIQDLLVECKSLMISSVATIYIVPHASYAPFLYRDGCFYIMISEMAQHAFNLAESGIASVMVIQDESNSPNLFARHRLTLNSRVEEVPYGGDDWYEVTDEMEKKFGAIIKQLRSFTDIHLFRIIPSEGRYVCGFGQAYTVNGALDQADAITGDGHKTVDD